MPKGLIDSHGQVSTEAAGRELEGGEANREKPQEKDPGVSPWPYFIPSLTLLTEVHNRSLEIRFCLRQMLTFVEKDFFLRGGN